MAPPVVFPEQRKDDTQREESHSVAQWGLTESTRRPDGGWMIAPPHPEVGQKEYAIEPFLFRLMSGGRYREQEAAVGCQMVMRREAALTKGTRPLENRVLKNRKKLPPPTSSR